MNPLRILMRTVLLVQRGASAQKFAILGIVVAISLGIWALVQAGLWPKHLHLPIGLLVRMFAHH